MTSRNVSVIYFTFDNLAYHGPEIEFFRESNSTAWEPSSALAQGMAMELACFVLTASFLSAMEWVIMARSSSAIRSSLFVNVGAPATFAHGYANVDGLNASSMAIMP
eukprot:CAMPEP_0201920136 /NCGR_PEP_ID=MMETSP0903-20130614/8824_1 /ASSEMBLY_ACC=CAM_ASM_000552 /TAXON_ID=420261 /ORGANISM="Thalassiosira antarctica, Strain CCMP982" /LENGTH=106 /DNA_ID=CAMNT_0048456811 /DNA_START=316 /DNA_END=636 /DNA_ORIENTATION=-